jgi:hypothetical protein
MDELTLRPTISMFTELLGDTDGKRMFADAVA